MGIRHNACKYYIGLGTNEEDCNNFDQSIGRLLNYNDIDKRIKFRKNLMNKISGLHDMINEIVHRYDRSRDRHKIKANMDDIVDQFRSMFPLLNKNEVIDEDSINNCVINLYNSICLTNECVKNYIIKPIIFLTEKIDNNEKTQETVINICEIKFNSFNSFVKNYEDVFDLIGALKEKYMKQSKKNQ